MLLVKYPVKFNFGALTTAVRDRSRLTPPARLLLTVLDSYGEKVINPYLETLAVAMGYAPASTKTVLRAAVELVQGGFLEVRPGPSSHSANFYNLKLPLYCQAFDPGHAQQLQAIPFPVNLCAWPPAIPGGGEIPAGHAQLSNGQVVPLDDIPAMPTLDQLNAQRPPTSDRASAYKVRPPLFPQDPASLAPSVPSAAVLAPTWPPAAVDPPDPVDLAVGLASLPFLSKKIFICPPLAQVELGLSQANLSISDKQPSRLVDNGGVAGGQRYKESQNGITEKEIRPYRAIQIPSHPAWDAWTATWSAANKGLTWIWSSGNVQAAEKILAAVGPDALAQVLQKFSKKDHWLKNGEPGQRLPLQALAKYVHEYQTAFEGLEIASTAAPAAASFCDHESLTLTKKMQWRNGQAVAVVQEVCQCGYRLPEEASTIDFLKSAVQMSPDLIFHQQLLQQLEEFSAGVLR